MGFKCGIVGLPNVGKSTLFNALTKANIKTENFPFCTINANIGIIPVPDIRLKQIANIVNPKKIMPTNMHFVDIAGLIKGASKGEGLGNQFLTNIRETEAICHVVRCFKKDNIIHVEGRVCPTEDIDIVNTELALTDLQTCENNILRLQKLIRHGDKKTQLKLLTLEKCLFHLSSGGVLRTLILSSDEENTICHLKLLTLKPTMYIANVNEDGFDNNSYLDEVRNIALNEGSIVITICAKIESDIAKLKEEEQEEFLLELGLTEPGLNHVIRVGYELLKLQTYFTAGIKEVRAWTIPVGATAPKAAGRIHTDFEKGFIRAQIISFTDFITYKGEQGAKEAGKVRSEGKKYIVQDGDIINFLFNT